jgi:aspartate 1-decarboxylase
MTIIRIGDLSLNLEEISILKSDLEKLSSMPIPQEIQEEAGNIPLSYIEIIISRNGDSLTYTIQYHYSLSKNKTLLLGPITYSSKEL